MKIIKFFSSFCDSESPIEAYIRIHELYNDPNFNKTYKFTSDEDYTHVIIMNTAMPELNIPKNNVIGIAFEPPQFLKLTQNFLEYANKYISKYYIGDNTGLPMPFINSYSYMYHSTPLKYIPEKNKLMSIMISNKTIAPGHIYRHIIVENILKFNLPIDIYGRGCVYYDKLNDDRIKGEFTGNEIYENYIFHIAIENFQTNDYFSEKIVNSLLCHTCPIYFGAKNINNYFNNIIKLTGDINKDITLLINICNNPNKYIYNIDIKKIKETVSITNII